MIQIPLVPASTDWEKKSVPFQNLTFISGEPQSVSEKCLQFLGSFPVAQPAGSAASAQP